MGKPRIQHQMVSSSKVCTSGLTCHYTMAHSESNRHGFYVILDHLQENFTHQEGPWGKEGHELVTKANVY